jgi:acyl carrier protein
MCDEIIREIIQEQIGDIDINDEANLFSMGADSDDRWAIVQEIEQSLGITLDDDLCDEAESILDFINLAKESPSNVIH